MSYEEIVAKKLGGRALAHKIVSALLEDALSQALKDPNLETPISWDRVEEVIVKVLEEWEGEEKA